jgi:hypothetical protein
MTNHQALNYIRKMSDRLALQRGLISETRSSSPDSYTTAFEYFQ